MHSRASPGIDGQARFGGLFYADAQAIHAVAVALIAASKKPPEDSWASAANPCQGGQQIQIPGDKKGFASLRTPDFVVPAPGFELGTY